MTEGPQDPGDPPEQGNPDPFRALSGGGPGGGLPDLGTLLHRLGDLLSGSSGPVNWALAKETALQLAGSGDPGTSAADNAAVDAAVRLADHWLDAASTLPSGVRATEAWSRRRWVEATLPAWSQLTDPVLDRVGQAIGGALPEEMRGMAGPLLGVLRQMGGLLFGAQVGQGLGQLAREVVSATDVGLPLGPAGRAALLPTNVTAFGAGLGVPAEDVRVFLALREAAHQRLFEHVPWLRGHLFEAVDAYARGIRVDTGALQEAVSKIDPSDPESLQRALGGGLFEPADTPEQQAALRRLETALALVEGWVDEVVAQAADGHLPSADALRETVRRRRAAGGPAEQTFGTLVGLQLRPRRLRDAAALWRALLDARGMTGRDALWGHPDLLPAAEDLDDPAGFVDRPAGPEVDVARLLEGPPPGQTGGGTGPGQQSAGQQSAGQQSAGDEESDRPGAEPPDGG